MFFFDRKADQVLLRQVLAFIAMTAVVFFESVLGLVPALYGSVPKISLCILFLIALYRPQAISLYPIMLTGLIYDAIQGNPFGYTSSMFLIILLVVAWRRPILIIVDPSVVWSEFIITLLGLMIYMTLVFLAYHTALPPFSGMLFQIGLTALLFPVVNWMASFARHLGLYIGSEL